MLEEDTYTRIFWWVVISDWVMKDGIFSVEIDIVQIQLELSWEN